MTCALFRRCEELMCPRRQLDEVECAKKFKVDLAFKMLSCGRTDLVPHALQLLPATKVRPELTELKISKISLMLVKCEILGNRMYYNKKINNTFKYMPYFLNTLSLVT